MRRLTLALGVLLLLLAAACGREEQPVVTETPEETETETPEVTATFELQGRVLETLASATAGQEQPSPGATGRSPTPTGSPTGSPTASPTDSPIGGGSIERGAPGSMSIRLTSYSAQNTACNFQQGDTVVVSFTRVTQFTPQDVREANVFPRNLRNSTVAVRGTAVEAENCILSADSVDVQAQATPTGAARATPSPTGRTSPTPTGRATPSPTRT